MMGCEAVIARDGRQAVELARSFRPDTALLDIGMPKLDGNAAARRIRGEPWGENIKLIAISGWGQAEDGRQTAAAGFDHHLVKPVDPALLNRRWTHRTAGDGSLGRCRRQAMRAGDGSPRAAAERLPNRSASNGRRLGASPTPSGA